MYPKTVYHFVDSNLGVEKLEKEGLTGKKGKSFGSCSAWERSKWLTLETEGFAWRTRGRGKLYRLTIK